MADVEATSEDPPPARKTLASPHEDCHRVTRRRSLQPIQLPPPPPSHRRTTSFLASLPTPLFLCSPYLQNHHLRLPPLSLRLSGSGFLGLGFTLSNSGLFISVHLWNAFSEVHLQTRL